MELVIAGAVNLIEMEIVKVNKFNEATNIGYYTVNNETGEVTLTIRAIETREVGKTYYNARNGISHTMITKTKAKMKRYMKEKT